jgi:long-chain acyl-CoA synthetase
VSEIAPVRRPDDPAPSADLYNLGDLTDRAQDPGKLALIDCLDWQHPREYTHGEMSGLATACARGLLTRGLRRGNAVTILSANRAEFLIAYLGAMRAGLVAVPVNHKFPPEMVSFVLSDSGSRLVLCDGARRGLVPAGLPVIDFDRDDWQALLDPGEFTPVRPRPNETAMVLYTSGSSGRPKGVPLSHEGHLWAVTARLREGPYAHHRLLVAAPLFHMNALGTAKFGLAAHATIVLLPQFDARRYLEAIERFRVSWLTAVPTMLAMALREHDALGRIDRRSVKQIRMGSAPVSQTLIDDVKRAFPGAMVSNVYGTTEAGPVMFGPAPGREKPDLALGWPLPGVEVRIVDDRGRDAEEGVLWIRTPATMIGYLNLPEKTREVLTPDGWYISGDVFRRDGRGAYHFVGRADDMFVCGGENIYPGEVEAMLELHPEIVQACVVPVPDPIKGEKPVAFVVTPAESRLSESDVKRYALARAPAYQHPRRVVFLKELPLAGTSKVDRRALQSLAVRSWEAEAQLATVKPGARRSDRRPDAQSRSSAGQAGATPPGGCAKGASTAPFEENQT